MPWYWTAMEGPGIAVFGVVILWLVRAGGKENGEKSAQG